MVTEYFPAWLYLEIDFCPRTFGLSTDGHSVYTCNNIIQLLVL